jgi:hypothetical protein
MWADYLAAVLPGLADVPIQRLPELTPFTWANRAPLARIVIFDYCCTVCVTDAELSAMFESPL